jgi:hypothetical protein
LERLPVDLLFPVRADRPFQRALSAYIGDLDLPVLATDSLSAPRSSLLACDTTWKWALSAEPDIRRAYEQFWTAAIEWLASVDTAQGALQVAVEQTADDRPTARVAFHVKDVPVDCNMRGAFVWTSPDTGRSTMRLPPVVNIKENTGRAYYGSYVFKKDDHDGLYTCDVALEFHRAGHQPRARVKLKPLRFRFKGRKRPGATLEDVTVASRKVDFRIWDNGGLEDDVINVYVDGRAIISGWMMPEAGKNFSFTIPADRDEVVFTIESVSSEQGPNTAAITFKGAIEVSRRQQSWWIQKPGQKASCVITYKPPMAPDPNQPGSPDQPRANP